MLVTNFAKSLFGLPQKSKAFPCRKILCYSFGSNPKFKVVEDPKEANKLVFEDNGKCRIFEHKNG